MKIGPFPKGMPVNLITSMDVAGFDLPESQRAEHRKVLVPHAREERAQGQPGSRHHTWPSR